MHIGILRLYCGNSGQRGYYNIQELGLAKAFAKQGIKVTVFLLDSNIKEVHEEAYSHHVKIMTVPAKTLGCHGVFRPSVLKEQCVDVLQIAGDNQIFMNYVYRYCKRNNIFCYFYVGTLKSETENILKKFVFRFILKRNIEIYKQSILFVKTKNLLKVANSYGITNAILAPVGLDFEQIPEVPYTKVEAKKLLGIPTDKKVVLFVGRLEDYKRPLVFFEIMKSLQTYDTYQFIMIGSGNLKKKLLHLVQDNELTDVLIYLKKVDNQKIQYYYRASDYYVNLNPNEIFGMGILEAMHQGTTVIANRAPGPETIIENNISGFLVADVLQTVDYLQRGVLLSEKCIRNRARFFEWDKTAQNMLTVLHGRVSDE